MRQKLNAAGNIFNFDFTTFKLFTIYYLLFTVFLTGSLYKIYSAEITTKSGEVIKGNIVKIVPKKYCIVETNEGRTVKINSSDIKDTDEVSETEKRFLGIHTDLFLGISLANFIPDSESFKKEYGASIFIPSIELSIENLLPVFDLVASFEYLNKNGIPEVQRLVTRTITDSDGNSINEKIEVYFPKSNINIVPITCGIRYSPIFLKKFIPYLSLKLGPYIIQEKTTLFEIITDDYVNPVIPDKQYVVENLNTVNDTNLGYQIGIGIIMLGGKNTITKVEIYKDNIKSGSSELGGLNISLNISHLFR